MDLKLDKYNQDVIAWAQLAVKAFKAQATTMGITHRSNSPSKSSSINKLKERFRYKDGGVHVIGVVIDRSLIYVHHGAGKGKGGLKGSRWVDQYGAAHSTNPKSLGKENTGKRKAKPFIENVLEGPDGMAKLGDIVANDIGDAIIDRMFLK